MRIGIHISNGDFSSRWVQYCVEKQIPYKAISCYRSDIVAQLSDCDALMWHHNHVDPKDVVFAKQVLFALEASGKTVFPDFATNWHFDDKLGQKYLLESFSCKLVNSYSFFSEKDALEWIRKASFPKVFKLRCGAGSENVKLVSESFLAVKLAHKAFRRGFRQSDVVADIKDKFRKFREKRASFKDFLKAFAHLLVPYNVEKSKGNEKGYLYLQDFIPGNYSDTRIVVIGERAFGLKRLVRRDDFRASGSGHIIYDHNQIDVETVKLAFEINRKLNAQCLAFDFIHDQSGIPYVVEISYGFADNAYDACEGYWDDTLGWHEGMFNPYGWMVETVIDRIKMQECSYNAYNNQVNSGAVNKGLSADQPTVVNHKSNRQILYSVQKTVFNL